MLTFIVAVVGVALTAIASFIAWSRGNKAADYNQRYLQAQQDKNMLQAELKKTVEELVDSKKETQSYKDKYSNLLDTKTKIAPKVEVPKKVDMPKKFILFDTEATCEADGSDKSRSETIEIAAALFENGVQVDTFHTYVKPLIKPVLSDYCMNLTKITQQQVDSAPTIDKAIKQFKEWIKTHDPDMTQYWLVSWGHYDRQQLAIECERYNQNIDWLIRHTSLKHEHARINRLRMGLGIGQALRKENLEFTGVKHTATDDTVNMAKIFLKYFPKLTFVSPRYIKRKENAI